MTSAAWEGLQPEALAKAVGLERVEIFASVSSTSDVAKARVREGSALPLLVVADEQTRGRGRGASAWVSPRGSGVWASVALPSLGAELDRILPLRTGLRLATRLTRLVSGVLGLKWPNDLFLRRERGRPGKVAGILCERISASSSPTGHAVVVGVGINVSPPGEVDATAQGSSTGPMRGQHSLEEHYPAAGLTESGPVRRVEVLKSIVEAVRDAHAARSPDLSGGELESWNRMDILMGGPVRVISGQAAGLTGVAEGLDARGRLLIRGDGSVHAVESGRVRPDDGASERLGALPGEE